MPIYTTLAGRRGGGSGGGSGLPAVGTAGNLLTSNGTAWVSQPEHWVEDTGDDVTAASGKQWTYTGGGTATPTSIFKAGTGRTGSVTEWQDPAGTVVASVDAAGIGKFGNGYFGETSGSHPNVALGASTKVLGATGHGNIVAYTTAAANLTSGSYNVLLGDTAGYALTSGGRNIALGYRALATVDEQSNNVAIGATAMHLHVSSGNTGVGAQSGSLSSADTTVQTWDTAKYPFKVGEKYRLADAHTVDGVSHNTQYEWTATKPDHVVTNVRSGATAVVVPVADDMAMIGYLAATGHQWSVAVGSRAQARTLDSPTIQLGNNAETYTKIGVGNDRLIPLAELKTLVAGANSWHEFQTAIASLT